MTQASKTLKAFIVALPIISLMSGCVPTGERPFLMVQLCVMNEDGMTNFKSTLLSVAQSEGMAFIDGGQTTQRDLKEINKTTPVSVPTDGIVNIGVERPDGVGLGAGNVGLPKYQMVVGFSEGSEPTEARAFAQRTVDKLKTRWNVETVPSDRGALPMKDCGASGMINPADPKK